jgi:hypothetical protein
MNSSGRIVTSDAPIHSHGIQGKCDYIDHALLSHHIETVACLFFLEAETERKLQDHFFIIPTASM